LKSVHEQSRLDYALTWERAVGLPGDLCRLLNLPLPEAPPAADSSADPSDADGREALRSLENPPPRMSFDLAKGTITLDGIPYEISSPQAIRWVKVLAEHPGDWITGPELHHYDEDLAEPRTSRWRQALPEPISRWIETKGNKGSRWTLA
jgi:hypothetical protein